MARQWSARCYGVARQREGSRQNSTGSPALTLVLTLYAREALNGHRSARTYGVAWQREGSRQNSIGGSKYGPSTRYTKCLCSRCTCVPGDSLTGRLPLRPPRRACVSSSFGHPASENPRAREPRGSRSGRWPNPSAIDSCSMTASTGASNSYLNEPDT
jgi:hypothetical protein